MEAVNYSYSWPLGSLLLLKGDLSGVSLGLPQAPKSSSKCERRAQGVGPWPTSRQQGLDLGQKPFSPKYDFAYSILSLENPW